ncbi:putative Flp/Fap pilin component [Vibrio nigripulchritudo SO65]|uniref:Flp/Fap pilin component n=1 Tax=Vibrio nigripulchritudo SOn1 TaxID=1238450 RepID=A0AAV2VYN9_9VIBR|nr:Flp family type IVb pilin [Vibrio nigripulchritudo]CCN37532.1 putative Flp/Fap pilin component [Vibrio nigripulchritudo AM115]CCN41866.1 putative Flp/Fap pilin component [Vibrio nigripulchritudo FTn2]CCN66341.1 putative Flp/Fap pilin component [Vibrio nigripulchritudo POn4]CCN74698.1 putative Flp/Fap pilin component [Vibrio nigripulchritudo SO65]CCO49813.1 putative Flp/Fap pilin component [Vibrio nigripulchritudo SOn1]
MLTKLFVNAQLALENFKKDERGVTAIEYAIIAVAITGLVFAVFKNGALGNALNNAFNSISTKIGTIQ